MGTIPITSAMMMVMMMSILVPFKGKKQLDLHTQTCDVETEAQMGGMRSQVKICWPLPLARSKTGNRVFQVF